MIDFQLVIVLIFQLYTRTFAISNFPLLLIVSLDGLRYDFVSHDLTPNIWNIAQEGVLALHGIQSQVNTVTSPNHHCIATGLYQESHGIVGNQFYDPVFDEHFDNWNIAGNESVAKNSYQSKWFSGEPIWRTNMQEKGRLSGSMHWPFGEVEFPDRLAAHKFLPWKDYNNVSVWMSEIDNLIEWFTNKNEPINFGLYYNAEPDHAMHGNDIYSDAVKEKIKEVDNVIGYLVERLKAENLYEKINIILTADHGHANILANDNLGSYLDFENSVLAQEVNLFPRPKSNVTVDEIVKNLTRAVQDGLHFTFYRKEDIPEKYHYKNNRRIGPVVLFPDLNYYVVERAGFHSRILPRGTHGYTTDYPEMKPFFVARGPAFKKGYKISGDFIQNIDLYPLMCHLLKIAPAPNNGSLDRISVVLSEVAKTGMVQPARGFILTVLILTGVLVPLALLFLLLVSGCNVFSVIWRKLLANQHQKNQFVKNGYQPLATAQPGEEVTMMTKTDDSSQSLVNKGQKNRHPDDFPGDWAGSENEL